MERDTTSFSTHVFNSSFMLYTHTLRTGNVAHTIPHPISNDLLSHRLSHPLSDLLLFSPTSPHSIALPPSRNSRLGFLLLLLLLLAASIRAAPVARLHLRNERQHLLALIMQRAHTAALGGDGFLDGGR